LQPKVEIMIAAAMHIAPGFPDADFIAATATRSWGAADPGNDGSADETFASTYKTTTTPEPTKSAGQAPPRIAHFTAKRDVGQAVWANRTDHRFSEKQNGARLPAVKPGCAICGLKRSPTSPTTPRFGLRWSRSTGQEPGRQQLRQARQFCESECICTSVPSFSPRDSSGQQRVNLIAVN
jgi:hypothetical protein